MYLPAIYITYVNNINNKYSIRLEDSTLTYSYQGFLLIYLIANVYIERKILATHTIQPDLFQRK